MENKNLKEKIDKHDILTISLLAGWQIILIALKLWVYPDLSWHRVLFLTYFILTYIAVLLLINLITSIISHFTYK